MEKLEQIDKVGKVEKFEKAENLISYGAVTKIKMIGNSCPNRTQASSKIDTIVFFLLLYLVIFAF